MKLVTKHYIELSAQDKTELLVNARDISQGISAEEFVDYVELLLNRVVDLLEDK